MGLFRFLSGIYLMTGLVLFPVMSFAADTLEPRAEIGIKAGSQRSILTTEFWAPLAQQSGRVIYTDVRLMGDDDQNREGNLGVGYRQIYQPTNSVLGGHLWIDRRRTENSNTFHQLTFGVESLGDKVDLRANGYVPLNGAKVRTTPNIGSATPYLAGSGIYYDTNGSITETPQYGVDAEIGYRLPILQKQVDTIRIYGGGYSFFKQDTETVTGFRVRTEAQINAAVTIGARFQYDEPRGSQGFLEATLKFPFKAKKLYQTDKLRSRLDESPERDIDIVTGAVVDNGLRKPVINTASGEVQRVLYVDNTNAQLGDGTKENPYNNLASAQTALQANDILYINHGDNTTKGMDQGIFIDKQNVQLIGSGSSFVFDNGKFSANNGENYNGFLLQAASSAPVITNVSLGNFGGEGISINNVNAYVSGLIVASAARDGIRVNSDGGNIQNIFISNVTTMGNRNGIFIYAPNAGYIDNVIIQNINSSGNTSQGIFLQPAAGGVINNTQIINSKTDGNLASGIFAQSNSATINTISVSDVSANANVGSGVSFTSSGLGRFANIVVNNITSSNNQHGLLLTANIGTIDNISASNILATGNSVYGVGVSSNNSGVIGKAVISGVTASGNATGVTAIAQTNGIVNEVSYSNINTFSNTSGVDYVAQTGGTIGVGSLSNVVSSNNSSNGVVLRTNVGLIGQLNVSDILTKNNGNYGLYVTAGNTSIINKAVIERVTSINNASHGMYFFSASATGNINNISVASSNVINNSGNGVYLRVSNVGGVVDVDLGGGSQNSAGQNRIFGNTGNDLNVDRTSVAAGLNWWNNGGAAPTRATLTNGATATYIPPLASDPRP